MKQSWWEVFILALGILLVIVVLSVVGGLLENAFTGTIGEFR